MSAPLGSRSVNRTAISSERPSKISGVVLFAMVTLIGGRLRFGGFGGVLCELEMRRAMTNGIMFRDGSLISENIFEMLRVNVRYPTDQQEPLRRPALLS
jgi:hypothetical protein